MGRRRKTILVVLAFLTAATPAIRTIWAEGDCIAQDPALLIGDLYAEEGALTQAITEYKRVLFFNQDGIIASSVHTRIASCYVAQKRWPEAIFHYRRAIQSASSLREIEDREFDLITALLASGREIEAERHLLRLRKYPELDARRLSLYLCVTYTCKGEWEKAVEELRRAFPAGEVSDIRIRKQVENLELLFCEARNTRGKSPNLAAWLSTAVPGAGQLYAGDPWDALNALVVNAGLAALIFAAAKQEWYLEGALLFLYPLRRYYLGNRSNARLAAERRNLAVDEQYRQRLVEGILSLLEAEDARYPERTQELPGNAPLGNDGQS